VGVWRGRWSGGPAGGVYTRLGGQLQPSRVTSLELDYRRPGYLEECVLDVLVGLAYLEMLGKSRSSWLGTPSEERLSSMLASSAKPLLQWPLSAARRQGLIRSRSSAQSRSCWCTVRPTRCYPRPALMTSRPSRGSQRIDPLPRLLARAGSMPRCPRPGSYPVAQRRYLD
jgi:hypothetical protein